MFWKVKWHIYVCLGAWCCACARSSFVSYFLIFYNPSYTHFEHFWGPLWGWIEQLINDVQISYECVCLRVPVGERHHEGHHVQSAADQQWKDLTELGKTVHPLIPRSQCAEFHNKLGRRPGTQRHPPPLQVRSKRAHLGVTGIKTIYLSAKRLYSLSFLWTCSFVFAFSLNCIDLLHSSFSERTLRLFI